MPSSVRKLPPSLTMHSLCASINPTVSADGTSFEIYLCCFILSHTLCLPLSPCASPLDAPLLFARLGFVTHHQLCSAPISSKWIVMESQLLLPHYHDAEFVFGVRNGHHWQ